VIDGTLEMREFVEGKNEGRRRDALCSYLYRLQDRFFGGRGET
jgi:hypothetical protein